MITQENHLHNIYLIKRVVNKLFEEIINKYEFKSSEYKYNIDQYDCLTVSIEKNNLIFYCWITKREAYELTFHIREWAKWKNKNFSFLRNFYFKNMKEHEINYSKKVNDESLGYEKYTYEWYEYLIKTEIKFIEDHFPEVFEKGILPHDE